jgi:hypothetical protein
MVPEPRAEEGVLGAPIAEQETYVAPSEIVPGDYLYVGHGWWGRVKKNDHSERADLWIALVGGMEFPIVMVPTDRVTVRRGLI